MEKRTLYRNDEYYEKAKLDFSRLYELVQGLEDGTYEVVTDIGVKVEEVPVCSVEFTVGYQVSFVNEINKHNIREFMNDYYTMRCETFSPVYIGVYQGEAELSFHIKDLKEAIALGMLFEQYSIWDWANGREIVIKR